MSILKK